MGSNDATLGQKKTYVVGSRTGRSRRSAARWLAVGSATGYNDALELSASHVRLDARHIIARARRFEMTSCFRQAY